MEHTYFGPILVVFVYDQTCQIDRVLSKQVNWLYKIINLKNSLQTFKTLQIYKIHIDGSNVKLGNLTAHPRSKVRPNQKTLHGFMEGFRQFLAKNQNP